MLPTDLRLILVLDGCPDPVQEGSIVHPRVPAEEGLCGAREGVAQDWGTGHWSILLGPRLGWVGSEDKRGQQRLVCVWLGGGGEKSPRSPTLKGSGVLGTPWVGEGAGERHELARSPGSLAGDGPAVGPVPELLPLTKPHPRLCPAPGGSAAQSRRPWGWQEAR